MITIGQFKGPWMVAVRTGRRNTRNRDKKNQYGNGNGKKDMRSEGKGNEKVVEDNTGDDDMGNQEVEVEPNTQSEKKGDNRCPSSSGPTNGRRSTTQVSEK